MNNNSEPPDPLPLPAEVLSRLLFSQSFDPVLIVEIETGILVECNPAAERVFGYPREQLIGMNQTQLHPPGITVNDLFKTGLGHMKPLTTPFEVGLQVASGEMHIAMVNASAVEIDGVGLVVEVFREISEQNEALARSREELGISQAKLSLAMAMTQSALWEGDVGDEGEFIFNDQFYSLYATTAEAEGGYTMSAATYAERFIHPDDIWRMAHEITLIKGTEDQKSLHTIEHRIIRRDGEVRHIAVRYMQYMNNQTGSIKTIGANQDITDSKIAEEKLLAAKQAADAANLAKSKFLANMSHEIRTPLNGIMGMLQLMQMQTTDETSREHAAEALSSCSQLSLLLGDILDLSRIEADRLVLEHKPFVLQDIMESVSTLFGPSADQAGLTVNFVVEDGIPPLVGDGYRLQQILNNLVGNAIKFTDAGEITVEAHRLASDDGICRLYFKVWDTGIGIEDGMQESLFSPFVQGEEDSDRKHMGTGLGLSIIKRLVGLMGGTLSFASERAKGTVFRFSIPFETSSSTGETKPEGFSLRQAAPLGLAVLVVEDDRVSRLALTRALEAFGCDVATAGDGEAALETLAAGSYDVVFMDRQLPRMDGVEATKAIRRGDAGSANRRVHVVALTAATMKDEKESFLKAEIDDYLAKPVDFRQLYSALQRFGAK